MKYFEFNDNNFNWNTFMTDHLSIMEFLNKAQKKAIIIVLNRIIKDLKEDLEFEKTLENIKPVKVK
jgi:4-hydroxy-L-threonine phosphate dehydrogenase PdxA